MDKPRIEGALGLAWRPRSDGLQNGGDPHLRRRSSTGKVRQPIGHQSRRLSRSAS
jgi:hypothetical protein